MAGMSRQKGARAERQVLALVRAAGWRRARRNFASGAAGGGDITAGPRGIHLEIKHHERAAIYEWILQAELDARGTGDIPVVAFRRNHSRWYAAIPLEELLELLAGRDDDGQ